MSEEIKAVNILGQAFFEDCQIVGIKASIRVSVAYIGAERQCKQDFTLAVTAVIKNGCEISIEKNISLEAVERESMSSIRETELACLEQLAKEGFTEKQSVAFGEELLKYAETFKGLPISALKNTFNKVTKSKDIESEQDLWR